MTDDMLRFEMPTIRPPSESQSLLIRVTRNCPWNRCTFCYGTLYNREKFELRPIEDVKSDILAIKQLVDEIVSWAEKNGYADRVGQVARANGVFWVQDDGVKTAFLGDSNTLIVKTDELVEIIAFLYKTFPTLERVTSYARGKTVLRKAPLELKRLKEAGLSRLHVGLETGDDELLRQIEKGITAAEMILAGRRVVDSGISLSEYVVLGLGGKTKWRQHAMGTASILNAIDPDFIRLRTLILKQGTPLYNNNLTNDFQLPTADEILVEERLLIENLDVTSQLFSDHVSNYLRIDGKLPKDKDNMLKLIDDVLKLPPEQRTKNLQPEYLRTI